ncbi:13343_t:CDS:1, partial [Gigaspora margarita]
SATKLIAEYDNIRLLFGEVNEKVIVIAFGIEEIINYLGIQVVEIDIDV